MEQQDAGEMELGQAEVGILPHLLVSNVFFRFIFFHRVEIFLHQAAQRLPKMEYSGQRTGKELFHSWNGIIAWNKIGANGRK